MKVDNLSAKWTGTKHFYQSYVISDLGKYPT